MITDTPSGSETTPKPLRWPVVVPDEDSRGALSRHSAWLAFAVYTAFALFLTWPLAKDPSGLLAGPNLAGDLAGAVAEISYAVAHHVFPFAPATLHGLNAPQGLAQPYVENLASLPGTAVQYGLGFAFGAVAGAAAFGWLALVGSGMAMFLLARRMFGSWQAALLAGFAFAFHPFAVANFSNHQIYADGFVLVLCVWRMFELVLAPTRRNALLGGAAAAFAMWWTPYFILIGGVAFATMAVVVLVRGRLMGEPDVALRAVGLASVPVVALVVGLGALTELAGGVVAGALRTQSIDQLYTYSARYAEWLLPDRNNLLFGSLTSGYLTSHLHGSNFGESSIYVGLSVLALALFGGWIAARSAWFDRRAAVRDPAIVAALSGLLLAAVAAWFSLPPSVQPFGIPLVTPSGVIYRLTSTWRDYSRFIELIELGLCLAMAFAISCLLKARALRTRRAARVAIAAAIGIVLVLDLWARPPVRATPVSPPPEYVWLRDHPGGIVADYPLMPGDYPHYQAELWQDYDGHPLLQGYGPGTESESLKLDLADLADARTAGYLAALGVRYIVVHPGLPGVDPATLSRHGFKLRVVASDGDVWQVTAAPARRRVDALDQFDVLRGVPGDKHRWMLGDGVLGVSAVGCRACMGTVRFMATSNIVARVLSVTDEYTDRVLARVRVPVGRYVLVTVPGISIRNGADRLVLTTNVPPSWPPAGVRGWPRSVAIVRPSLTLAGSPRR